MQLDLADKNVLISGSSRGIGKATARAFLAEGSRVTITGRDTESLARAQTELAAEFGADHVMACEGDLTRPDVIGRVLGAVGERWGPLDCLVANIGSGRGVPGWDAGDESWADSLAINLTGGVRLVTEVLRGMTERASGSVVMVASITGVEGTPAPLAYSAAKAAVINYAANLSRLVAPHNLRVNSVAPGNVLFEGGSWERHLAERREEVLRQIESEVPMRRFGRPEEIADVIVFLSSSRASFVTGTTVIVDGGQTRTI